MRYSRKRDVGTRYDFEEDSLFGKIFLFFYFMYVVVIGYAYMFWQHIVLAIFILTVLFGSYFLFR